MNIFEKRFISRFESNLEEFNLSSLGNKLALKTEWSPLGTNGTHWCSHRAQIKEGANGPTITFQATTTGYMTCMLWAGVGLVFLIIMIPALYLDVGLVHLLFIAPIAFIGQGLLELRLLKRRERRFDKSSGKMTSTNTTYGLSKVRAIQLIRVFIGSPSASQSAANPSVNFSFQINLIQDNGARLNVVDHGKLKIIRGDAKLLSEYLEIPIWDMTEYRIQGQSQTSSQKPASWNQLKEKRTKYRNQFPSTPT